MKPMNRGNSVSLLKRRHAGGILMAAAMLLTVPAMSQDGSLTVTVSGTGYYNGTYTFDTTTGAVTLGSFPGTLASSTNDGGFYFTETDHPSGQWQLETWAAGTFGTVQTPTDGASGKIFEFNNNYGNSYGTWSAATTVAATPEPGSAILLAAAALAAGLMARKRMRMAGAAAVNS